MVLRCAKDDQSSFGILFGKGVVRVMHPVSQVLHLGNTMSHIHGRRRLRPLASRLRLRTPAPAVPPKCLRGSVFAAAASAGLLRIRVFQLWTTFPTAPVLLWKRTLISVHFWLPSAVFKFVALRVVTGVWVQRALTKREYLRPFSWNSWVTIRQNLMMYFECGGSDIVRLLRQPYEASQLLLFPSSCPKTTMYWSLTNLLEDQRLLGDTGPADSQQQLPGLVSRYEPKKLSPKRDIYETESSQWAIMEQFKSHNPEKFIVRDIWECKSQFETTGTTGGLFQAIYNQPSAQTHF